ncbi:MAG: aldehyde dehydrogenase family protein [Candidatus Kapaibacteriales bacterium]
MKFSNIIDNNNQAPTKGDFFQNINPADNSDLIGEFPLSRTEDVLKAVSSAKEAFKKWKALPAPKRGDILRKLGDLLTEHKNKLATVMTREMGKPVFETEGDVQEAIDTCYYAATETRRLFGMNAPSEMNEKMNLSFRVPIGVCGIITAWNFPIAVPSWKIIPALACGNTIVWKPSEDAPHSGNYFVELMIEAGLPEGVVNLVHGDGKTGDSIVRHPDVSLIGFTGSTETGNKIAGLCGELGKKVSLEMGGKNAQIVMEDANLDLVVDGALWGAYGTTGQRCTATSRLILQESIHDEVVERIKDKAVNLLVGHGLESSTEMGPVINQEALSKILEYIEIGKKEGAKLEFGGQRLEGDAHSKGFFIQPTLFTNVTKDMRIFQEEIFGPVLSVSTFNTYSEAIHLANATKYGLSSSIYTKDVNLSWRAIRDLEAGITYINAPTIGAEAHMPFGGVKGTGNGHREGGWTAFDIFTEWKTVYIDYSDSLQRAQIDNY